MLGLFSFVSNSMLQAWQTCYHKTGGTHWALRVSGRSMAMHQSTAQSEGKTWAKRLNVANIKNGHDVMTFFDTCRSSSLT